MNPTKQLDAGQAPRPWGEVAYACFIWAVMVAIASSQVSMAMPFVLHAKEPTNLRVSDAGDIILLAVFWLWSLVSEWQFRYDPQRAAHRRKLGLMAQGIFLGLIGVLGWLHRQPTLGILYASTALSALALWAGWMKSLKLHPNDQKIIDELRAKEQKLIARELQEAEQRKREAKLRSAMAQLCVAQDQTTPLGEPPIRWVIPDGKHGPLVYFVENGNRVKIGTTSDLRRRIRELSLRPGNIALILPGNQSVERSLHHRFAAHRIGTSEWFQNTGSLAQFIADEYAKARSSGKSDQH